MNPAALLEILPPFQFRRDVKVKKQTTGNIIIQVLQSHRQHESDYDLIASQFEGGNIPKKLFDFCQAWLPYKEEPGKDQTTRSPAGILTLADHTGVDCKHYANFIAGIIDALNRQGENINWCYRFVSYRTKGPDKKMADHVFVVLLDEDIWIDPAPLKNENGNYYERAFNDRYAIPVFYMDIKTDSMLSHLSGVHYFISDEEGGNNGSCVGITSLMDMSSGGDSDEGDSGDGWFVDLLKQAGDEVKKFFSRLFNTNWQNTIGVRWLIAYYQYYVLGDSNATSSNKVNEAYLQDCQGWFAVVLGVPIYDRYRLHALMGTDPANGTPLMKTDQQKASEYLAFGPDTQDVDPVAVAQAVQIAKKLKWGTPPGTWRQFSVPAPDVIEPVQPPGPVLPPPPPPQGEIVDPTQPPLPPPDPKKAGINTLGMLLLGGAAVGLLMSGTGKKRKRKSR